MVDCKLQLMDSFICQSFVVTRALVLIPNGKTGGILRDKAMLQIEIFRDNLFHFSLARELGCAIVSTWKTEQRFGSLRRVLIPFCDGLSVGASFTVARS